MGLTAEQRARLTDPMRSSVGASRIPAVCNVCQYGRTAADVQLEMLGMVRPWGGNAATRMGDAMEPVALDYAEPLLGPLRRDVEVHDPELGGIMVVHLDGQRTNRESVEGKTSGIVGPLDRGWGDPGTDQIPANYRIQGHGHMAATETGAVHFTTILGGRGHTMFILERCDELVQAIRFRVAEFFNHHIKPFRESGTFVPCPIPPNLDTLRRLIRDPNNTQVIPDAAVNEWAAKRLEASEMISAAEHIRDEADHAILRLMGLQEAAVCVPSGRMLHYREQLSAAGTPYRVLRLRG